jgi:ABC-type oligopeptide transport system substrate-binding subunit/DNA-binding SARP family transcriptional activator/Mrp family chromosome partitioning ATPase
MAALRFYLLGAMDIRHDREVLSKPATLKSQSLLAYLILHRDRPQSRDRLVGLFWGESPERKARGSLSTALWHIRRCLPELCVNCEPQMVQLDPGQDLWVDVEDFEACMSQGSLGALQSAVALYRGDFMDGFYHEWVIDERFRLEALFMEALARLMVGLEARGESDQALAVALRLLQRDPLREEAHRLAMRAFCRLGQRNAALAQYRRCCEIVKEELGTDPMVETTELYEEIREGRFPVGPVPDVAPTLMVTVPPSPPAGRSPLEVPARSLLIGRNDELAFLDGYWARAAQGQGRLVLISGEAGVGKSLLAAEFASRLRAQGVRVLWGNCYEYGRSLPYQPIAEALRTVLPALTAEELGAFPSWSLDEAVRLVPEVAEKRAGLQVTPSTPSDEQRARLFEGVSRVLTGLSSSGAILVVLEDLHWASESTLQLVHYLARRLSDHPVLMLCSFRSDEVGLEHPLHPLRRRLVRDGLAVVLRLPRLPPVAVEEVVTEMSGAGEEVLPLAKRLYRETEGNPFYLIETIRGLFDAGSIRREEGVWAGDFAAISEGTLALPASLSEAVEARVQNLSDDAQVAVRLAAVLGREFDFELLNAVWDQGEGATLEALDELLRRRLIDEGVAPKRCDYNFSHNKIQEVIYASMSRRRRQQAHALVATTMENLYRAQAEELAGELGFHFQEGRYHDKTLTGKAIFYRLRAGDRARTLYAHQEAIEHYQQALAMLKEEGQFEKAARTLMKLGLTHHNAFDFERAREAFHQGFWLWQRAGDAGASVKRPPAQHALRVAWHVFSLDPALAEDFPSVEVVRQLFSGLVDQSPEMDVIPDVANSWDVLDGGRRYVFHLRDDVLWSDGRPVTAADFEYAWKRVLNPAFGWASAHILYDIEGARAFHRGELSDPGAVGVRAQDPLTLVVELEGPTSYLPHLMTHWLTYPVPSHVVQTHGEAWTETQNIVTNGPFRLESWERGRSMVLVLYQHYHRRVSGNVQKVDVILNTDPSVELDKYEDGQLDIGYLWELSAMEMDLARQRHAGEYMSGPSLATWLVRFKLSGPPFDDVRVRRAFVMATDRDSLAEVDMKGHFFPATGGVIPPGMPAHSPGIGLECEVEGARRLLAEAGYPEGRPIPEVTFLVPPSPSVQQAVERLKAQWEELLGVSVAVHASDWTTYFDRLHEEQEHLFFDSCLARYPDPDHCLRQLSSGQGAAWQNVEYAQLLERARQAMDQDTRITLYRQADRILIEEAPVIPIGYGRQHLLVKPWVSQIPTSAIKYLFWKDVVIEPH